MQFNVGSVFPLNELLNLVDACSLILMNPKHLVFKRQSADALGEIPTVGHYKVLAVDHWNYLAPRLHGADELLIKIKTRVNLSLYNDPHDFKYLVRHCVFVSMSCPDDTFWSVPFGVSV